MRILSLILLAILDFCIYSTISIPFIKRFNGKAWRLLPMLVLLAGMNMLDLVLGEAYPKSAYSAIAAYAILIISIYFALGNSLSLAVVICGICILISLPLEMVAFLVLSLLGIDITQLEYHTASIIIMCVIFFITILFRITLLPLLVRIVIRKADFLKGQAIIIINALFAFSIFKQYINFSGVPYYLYPLLLALFLTGIIFVYREMMDDRNMKSMLEQHKKMIDSVQPIIQDIRSRQHDFKNQISVIKLNLQLQGNNANKDLIEHVEALNHQFMLNDNFLTYSIQALGALMYIKYHEAARLGVTFTAENHLSNDSLFIEEELTIISLLSNLIDNAMQASAEFQGNKAVHVNLDSNQEEFRISVQNTGLQIPDNIMQKIFQRGYSLKHKYENEPHGYGLYNVRKLVDKAKGRIEIISGKETTTFLVIIPAVNPLTGYAIQNAS